MATCKYSRNNDPTLIPYTLHVEAVPGDSGCGWVYRVEYTELDKLRRRGSRPTAGVESVGLGTRDVRRARRRYVARERKADMSKDIYSVDPGVLPWIPVIDGVAAKPLRFASGGTGWASIVRIDPGCRVPKHRHSGEVQGVVLSGRCRYTDGSPWLGPGTYLHEADGAEDEVLACPDAGRRRDSLHGCRPTGRVPRCGRDGDPRR